MLQPIQLIATDYDNTLVGRDNSMIQMDRFAALVKQLRINLGTKWAIITGRDFKAMTDVLRQLSRRGLQPDYLVVSEGYIFKRTPLGYLPFWRWNFHMWRQQKQLSHRLKRVLPEWCREISETWPNSKNRSRHAGSLWFTFDSEETADSAEAFLNERLSFYPELILVRHTCEIYLGVTFCAKGIALNELAQKAQIPLFNTFAIGDGSNDISMLNGSAAGLTACVANARAEVKEAVKQSNGYLAQNNCLEGVIESINHYLKPSGK